MADPFATALGVFFAAPGSVAADWVPPEGDTKPIRVVLEQGVEKLETGQAVFNADRTIARIQRADVADPSGGSIRIIGGDTFEVVGEPALDIERVEWSCELVAI